MMTPAPKASSYRADPFDTAMEKEMSLNAAVEKGVVDLPSGSLPVIQKMKSICTTRFGVPQMVVDRLCTHASGNCGGRTLLVVRSWRSMNGRYRGWRRMN